jgi:hypothetical protein
MANPDTIYELGIGVVGDLVTGTVEVDYTTGLIVSSSLNLNVLGVQTPLLNITLASPTLGAFTISGATLAGTGVTLSFTGENPTTVSTQIAAVGVPVVNLVQTVNAVPACLASGTWVRTSEGEVLVEALKVGDLVVTSTGALRPVRWLGHRTVNCRTAPTPRDVRPVRIGANAIDVGRPDRDLFVSPGHAVCISIVDEILVPASALVNGSTIVQVDAEDVTYWHVELDEHDILFANGLPSESYIDVGNRSFFLSDGGLDGLPDNKTLADYCRPFHADGLMVDVIRDRLRARALTLGWCLTETPPFEGVRVVADGAVVEPVTHGLIARFTLPADAKDVWLVSEPYVPSQCADTADDRSLGLYLKHLLIDDGLTVRREVSTSDPLLCIGFHVPEDGGAQCWTTERARLPAALWEGCGAAFFLSVTLAGPGLPRWRPVAPHPAPQKSEGRHLTLVAA